MRIKTIILLAIALSLIGTLVAASGLYRSYVRVSAALGVDQAASKVARSVFDLNVLTGDFLLRPQARSRAQWLAKYETLGRELDQTGLAFAAGTRDLSVIRSSYANLGETFDLLARETGVLTAARNRLTTGMLITSRAMSTVAYRLQDRSQAVVRETLVEAVYVIGVLIAIVAVLVVSCSLYLGRRISQPIERLRKGLQSLGSGDLGYRIGSLGDDEIGTIAASVDSMAECLERTTVSRNELAKEVERRKETEKRMEIIGEVLQWERAQLEVANRELEAFSYSVSHDLRAPLRGISGFCQALEEDYADKLDETAENYIARIVAACQKMSLLIDDILALSRVTQGSLDIGEVDLSVMARTIATGIQERNRDRQIAFEIEPGMTVRGDRRMLQIALENLLDNAQKFTGRRSDAKVEFAMAAQNGVGTYYVRDNGEGFDMAYADKLFQPFQRLHSSTEFPGTGIGLATVARVIRRHGGKVWVDSQADCGTTVYFTV